MIKMKLFRCAVLIITLSAVCVISMGCSDNVKPVQEQSSTEVIAETPAVASSNQETPSYSIKESTTAVDYDIVPYSDTKTLKGYQIIDGSDYPVTVTIGIKDIQSGEDAYDILRKDKPDIPDAPKDMEYVIITVNVSYDEGDPDELSLAENQASLDAAKQYFSLGNSEDVTNYLDNSIYNMSVKKGESVQGDLAFIRKKGSNDPLGFWGFDSTAMFQMTMKAR